MNYNCQICSKYDTCKKNKNSNNTNCKLFIPDDVKELKAIKEQDEARKKLIKLKTLLAPYDFTKYI